MRSIYLDIETIPTQLAGMKETIAAQLRPPGNMSKAETIEAWERDKRPGLAEEAWRKTSFDGALGHVAVISAAIDDGAPKTFYDFVEIHAHENRIIRAFYNWLEEQIPEPAKYSTQFIGHRVADFDLRFLFQRSVVHRIEPPRWMPFHARPVSDRVYDTMVAWAGPREYVSLDTLCQVFGIAEKGSEIGETIDGSMVWDFIQAGRVADVAAYCAGDVERVREVHRRMTFWHGGQT